jgi:Uma2 family endonuclease
MAPHPEQAMSATAPPKPVVHYPDDDGLPMSDNTLQYQWIVTLQANAEAYYRDDPDVFAAGNNLIYAVEGDSKVRQAPDVYVAFGRPKGYRGSYKVWEEGGTFPQVVFEVWSPGNEFKQMLAKFAFYEKHGAEEYYLLYPEFPAHAEGWVRTGGKLEPVAEMNGFVSPRLGWRFELDTGELTVFGRDGRQLQTPAEMVVEREAAVARAAELAAGRDAAVARAAELAAKLRELGIDPDAV